MTDSRDRTESDPASPGGSAEPEVVEKLSHTPDGPPPKWKTRRSEGRALVAIAVIGLTLAITLGVMFGGLAATLTVVAFCLVFFLLGAMPALGAGAARVVEEEQVRDEVRQEREEA